MNDDAKKFDAAAQPAADQPASAADATPPATAPTTIQAVTKLNPGLDPFIFLGF